MKKLILCVAMLSIPMVSFAGTREDEQRQQLLDVGRYVTIMAQVIKENNMPTPPVSQNIQTPVVKGIITPDVSTTTGIVMNDPVIVNGSSEVSFTPSKPYIEAVSNITDEKGEFKGLIWSGVQSNGPWDLPVSNYERFENLTPGTYTYSISTYSSKRGKVTPQTDSIGFNPSDLVESLEGTFTIK